MLVLGLIRVVRMPARAPHLRQHGVFVLVEQLQIQPAVLEVVGVGKEFDVDGQRQHQRQRPEHPRVGLDEAVGAVVEHVPQLVRVALVPGVVDGLRRKQFD